MELKPLFVTKTEYLDRGDTLIAYVSVSTLCRAEAELDGVPLKRLGNLREPYDFCMHIFELPRAALERAGGFTLLAKAIRGIGSYKVYLDDVTELRAEYPGNGIVPDDIARVRADRHLVFAGTEESGENEGVKWRTDRYDTPDGKPVRVYKCRADARITRMIAGTPGGETEFRPKVLATVMEEALSAENAGEDVLFASNADFFEIFGDGRPSGLCVHNGHVVAGEGAVSPLFGTLKDSTPVIGCPADFDINDIAEAVSGGQIIVKDGKPFDTAFLEPFGEVPHPRTAFGIAENGDIIVIISDGRRPAWSNGTPLIELANMMIEEGAVIAMNADGGGSSTFIVKDADGLKMLNHPADLYRPDEDLVRPLFDSMLIVKRR